MGAWSEQYRSDGRSKKAPHNLSITKAQPHSRIFEVKQFEYTLFAGILLSGRSLAIRTADGGSRHVAFSQKAC